MKSLNNNNDVEFARHHHNHRRRRDHLTINDNKLQIK
jgi:hypothetical protein